jgi:hypothetical protein
MEIERKERDREITAAQAEMCAKWVLDGYYIAPGLLSLEKLERTWRAYEAGPYYRARTIATPGEDLTLIFRRPR